VPVLWAAVVIPLDSARIIDNPYPFLRIRTGADALPVLGAIAVLFLVVVALGAALSAAQQAGAALSAVSLAASPGRTTTRSSVGSLDVAGLRPRGVAAGEAEVKNRRTGERFNLPVVEVVNCFSGRAA
jgi:hypothetical protein